MCASPMVGCEVSHFRCTLSNPSLFSSTHSHTLVQRIVIWPSLTSTRETPLDWTRKIPVPLKLLNLWNHGCHDRMIQLVCGLPSPNLCRSFESVCRWHASRWPFKEVHNWLQLYIYIIIIHITIIKWVGQRVSRSEKWGLHGFNLTLWEL